MAPREQHAGRIKAGLQEAWKLLPASCLLVPSVGFLSLLFPFTCSQSHQVKLRTACSRNVVTQIQACHGCVTKPMMYSDPMKSTFTQQHKPVINKTLDTVSAQCVSSKPFLVLIRRTLARLFIFNLYEFEKLSFISNLYLCSFPVFYPNPYCSKISNPESNAPHSTMLRH